MVYVNIIVNRQVTYKAHLRIQIFSVRKSYQKCDLTKNKTNIAGPWPTSIPGASI